MTRGKDRSGGSPNPRRGERRVGPIIEGTAQQLGDLPREAAASAEDSQVSAANDDPVSSASSEPVTEPVSPDAPPTPEPPPRRAGAGLSGLSLIIAVLALVAVAALGWRVWWAPRQADAALRAQVAALRSRVDSLESSRAALAALNRQVSALSSRSAAASSAAQRAQADAAKALQQADAAGKAADQAAKAAAALKSGANARSSGLAALTQRVAALEQRPDASSLQASLSQQGSELEQKLAGLNQRLGQTDQRLASLQSKITAQAAQLTPLEQLLHQPKLDVAAIKASTSEATTEAASSALIVVARALQSAISSGAPFAAELDAARRLGADAAPLQTLSAFAAKGVATPSALRISFKGLAGPILMGVNHQERSGLLGRLTSGLGKLVRVRTIGTAADGDPAALVGEIEGDLAHGDVAGALAARNRLPPKDKALTKDWATQAGATVAAENAARAVLSSAIARLGKARS